MKRLTVMNAARNLLESHTARWLWQRAVSTHGGNLNSALEEFQCFGGGSALVEHLAHDTTAQRFYRQFQTEISIIVAGTLDAPADLPGFDRCDPLCRDAHNQQLLARFGFEHALLTLADRLDLGADKLTCIRSTYGALVAVSQAARRSTIRPNAHYR